MRDAGPAVALILADPEAPGRGPEGEPFTPRVERERMAVDDIVGMCLRQALGQDVEAFAAVARARDHEPALAWNALLILDLGDEPCRVGLARMHDHRKAERRWCNIGDLLEGLAFI